MSRELDNEDREIIESVKGKKYICILNKIDLNTKLNDKIVDELENKIETSTVTGFGIDVLKEKIKDMFFNGNIDTESIIITNTRHKQALFRAKENCEIALKEINNNAYLDLVSIYITSALKALGEITGAEIEEDLVNKIFSDFCVGK